MGTLMKNNKETNLDFEKNSYFMFLQKCSKFTDNVYHCTVKIKIDI